MLRNDVYYKVKVLENNLDNMFARSRLAQMNFQRIANQTKFHKRFGFTIGLIVDSHNSLSFDVTSASDGSTISLDPNASFRESFALTSRNGAGTPSVVLMRQEMFTHSLDTDIAHVFSITPQRYTYGDLLVLNSLPSGNVKKHHKLQIVESPFANNAFSIAWDPNSGLMIDAREIPRIDLQMSDYLRATFYHEGSHVFSASQGKITPIIQNNNITQYHYIVEELDTVGVLEGSSKGTFTEMECVYEQNLRRGWFTPLRLDYGQENMFVSLLKWRLFEPVSYAQWYNSGGRVNESYHRYD